MDRSVDDIIDRVCKIEEDVAGIMDRTETKKMVLSEQMAQRTQRYDAQLFEETNDRIESIRAKLEQAKEESLAGLNEETRKKLDLMQNKYDNHYDQWVEEILQSIVKV